MVIAFKSHGAAMGSNNAVYKAQAHAAAGNLLAVRPSAPKKGFENLCPFAARNTWTTILNGQGYKPVLYLNHYTNVIPCICVLENICKEISYYDIQCFAFCFYMDTIPECIFDTN